MRSTISFLALGLVATVLAPVAAHADVTLTRTFAVDQVINDGAQFANVQNLDLGGGIVTDVNVGLVLTATGTGAYIGDYYAAVGHETGYAVLLNRIGKTNTDDFGHNGSGLNVTFDEAAASADIHNAPFDPNNSSPGALTGIWNSDGRTADPVDVTNLSPRTATLSSFYGTNTDGEWRLLVADESYGGTVKLTSWSLAITFTPANGTLPALTASDVVNISSGTINLTQPQMIEATIINQGLIVAPSQFNEALTFTGHVTGAGNYQGNIVFLGNYSPGNSPAAVIFDGNLTLGPDNVLTMEIGGTAPGTGYDTLHVTGNLLLGGTLNIVFINGFTPGSTDSFQFFSAGSIGGSFAQLILPEGFYAAGDVLNGGAFTLAVPEPATIALLAGLSALALAALRRRARA